MKISGLSKSDFILSFKVIMILCIVTVFINLFLHGNIAWDNIKYGLFYNFYYGIPLSILNGIFFSNIDRIIPYDNKPKLRLWLGILGSITVTMLTVFFLNWVLWVIIWGNDFSVLFSERNRDFYFYAMIITAIISSFLHAVEFFKEIQNSKLREEKLRKENIASELSVLKSHLDPHFLFNSFNTLTGLIDEDPTKAKDMLAQISDVYRYLLDNKTEDTNTISAELDFSKKYFAIQQARFEEGIQLEINLDDACLDKKIPSLSMQLLLENAIKHNGFSDTEPLKITVNNENDHLVVSNNKKPRKNLASGSGMGLQNITDRYKLLNKKDIQIEDEPNFFKVSLPMI